MFLIVGGLLESLGAFCRSVGDLYYCVSLLLQPHIESSTKLMKEKNNLYFKDAFRCQATFTLCSSQVAECKYGHSIHHTECKTIMTLTCKGEQCRPKETKYEDSIHSGSL